MNYVIITLVFLIAATVAFVRDLPFAFMTIYLPAQLLVSSVPAIPIAFWAHISAPHAAIYGCFVGTALAGRRFPSLRLCLLDGVIVAFYFVVVFSAGYVETFHAALNVADNQLMEWVMPYFVARMGFQSEAARSAALRAIFPCLLFLGFFGFIETRLQPYYLSRTLQNFDLFSGVNDMVYHRFGFMRAQLTFGHPIDLGNVALILVGMVPLLAMTTKWGLRNRRVQVAWAISFFLLVISISFTGYFGLLAMLAMFAFLKSIKIARYHLAGMAVLIIGAVFIYSTIVLSQTMPPRPAPGDIFASSLWIRKLIIHRGWDMARGSGLLGFGKYIDTTELKLSSVDNAYLLMVLTRGWLTLGIFLLIPVTLGLRVSHAMRSAASQAEVNVLLLAAATVTGIMIAMYTVWFGFVYANLFLVLIGFCATLAEFFITAPAVQMPIEPESEWLGLAELV